MLMKIQVNGDFLEVAKSATVAELVAQLGLQDKYVAVERNRQVVPKKLWGETHLETDDVCEVVSLVGGG